MSRRFLLASAVIATLCMLAGLLVLDIPIVHWIHGSAFENAPFFVEGLNLLDGVLGIHVSYWLSSSVMMGAGAILLLIARTRSQQNEFALAILGSGIVQAATIGLMMLGKNAFGRMRPLEWIETGEMTSTWFVAGGSFPSGHSSFYFGLFLPLAAAAPRPWQRAVLLTARHGQTFSFRRRRIRPDRRLRGFARFRSNSTLAACWPNLPPPGRFGIVINHRVGAGAPAKAQANTSLATSAV